MRTGLRRLARKVLGDPGTPLPPQPELYPNWAEILGKDAALWEERRRTAVEKNGPHVLIATSVGGFPALNIVESALAVALTLRGAQPHVLLCDAALPACMRATLDLFPDARSYARHGPQRLLCDACFPPAHAMWQALDLPLHRYSELVTEAERREARATAAKIPVSDIGACRLDDLAVGEHAVAGALRFFARGDLHREPQAEPILRRYLEAALLSAYVTRRLLDAYPFAAACFNHGIYVPQGLIGEVARAENVRVVNWNPAYRKHCFIFSHHDTYHHTLLSEPVSTWEDMPWTAEMEEDILDYLKSRWQGTRDWIWFHEKPEEDVLAIARELGIDLSRPCIGMLTNVMWDAQLHYRANAFANMREWTVETIRYFAERRPDLQLVIRVHPAEIRGTVPSRQPIVEEIRRAFPTLPPNVFVVGPESNVSTYAMMVQCDSVIIYGTKTGVELTSLGIPVIVGGEAWIRNKGITLDASSADEYFELLERLPLREKMSEPATQRARKYAYHFFFRRMIPLPFIVPAEGSAAHFRLDLPGLEALLPGANRGLDVICDGILQGSPFVYPCESLQATRAAVRTAAKG